MARGAASDAQSKKQIRFLAFVVDYFGFGFIMSFHFRF
jgi:hypothetical protein